MKMWIDQCYKGVALRDIGGHYSEIHTFLSENFKGYFEWKAFDHRFFISDNNPMGRTETMKIINKFINERLFN